MLIEVVGDGAGSGRAAGNGQCEMIPHGRGNVADCAVPRRDVDQLGLDLGGGAHGRAEQRVRGARVLPEGRVTREKPEQRRRATRGRRCLSWASVIPPNVVR